MTSRRAVSDWLASLPRTKEFSLESAYQMFQDDHPHQAPTRNECAKHIAKSGLFERREDGKAVMFRYRGRAT